MHVGTAPDDASVEVKVQALGRGVVKAVLLARADDTALAHVHGVEREEAIGLLDHAREVRALHHDAHHAAAVGGKHQVVDAAELLGLRLLAGLDLLLGLLLEGVDLQAGKLAHRGCWHVSPWSELRDARVRDSFARCAQPRLLRATTTVIPRRANSPPYKGAPTETRWRPS